ncbi:hypothetical protein SHKM778_50580 [Streptomyces sp. KM77-8]|uniref:Uncharacterized protein n=1 Tax=Streptomyces haneummycinicus TaxID=3074435 RepID=A0AAT9HML5_9ACTN
MPTGVQVCSLKRDTAQTIPANSPYTVIRFPFGSAESADGFNMHQVNQPDGYVVTSWDTDARSGLIWPSVAGWGALYAMIQWEAGGYEELRDQFVRDPSVSPRHPTTPRRRSTGRRAPACSAGRNNGASSSTRPSRSPSAPPMTTAWRGRSSWRSSNSWCTRRPDRAGAAADAAGSGPRPGRPERARPCGAAGLPGTALLRLALLREYAAGAVRRSAYRLSPDRDRGRGGSQAAAHRARSTASV